MNEAVTSASIARFAPGPGAPPGGWPFFGQFGLAVQAAQAKKAARCLKKAKGRKARLKCDEVPVQTGGVLAIARTRPRTLTMSVFRDAVSRARLVEQVDPAKHYLAIELDDHSKALLRKHFAPNERGFQVDPGHVTLKHDLADSDLEWIQKHLGQAVNMRVTHHASAPGLHAVRVQPVGKRGRKLIARVGKEHPHVTVAFDPMVAKPKHSNDLLARKAGTRLRKFLHIGGQVRLLPKTT